ncbi:GntR family transcriptional regulator [Clostridium carboxidivorans P7]|uniref:Transcriptional regulator, GntR family with aminotransferase domain n=1 Tax=Clostridium carboxidivorans P7 TaxID=536227 RepID=C6PQG8_9CLOT|nr:PLP-dependent aminotransferase family protein [Clostridium carboxidivorans]AKN30440.1 GntR family transcriptional regulator [Clostridium carboxidivorans P7]EET88490.1 transcriptional regulator, GntR family with aminotransferase domain [Clostridium carboxidivorans P7]EFG86181.1 transcriptional regulator, GntR family [Clostridium carboxidivorans P7]
MSKYNDIVNYIISEVENKNLKYKQKLPTVRMLSEKFDCSKATVVRAYAELEKEHVVYSIPQSGYYLVENNDELNRSVHTDIINFSSAAPDKGILPYEEFQHCLNKAIDIYKQTLFDYSDSKGLPNLISVLRGEFQEYQIFCREENVFITSGSQQAINILFNMPFPNGKNNVLVEQPTYNGALKSLEFSSDRIIGIQRSFKGINLDELERRFANCNIKCFYTIPRFHNPLGTSYSGEEKKQILKLAEKYDVYIIEDDYLADLEIKSNSYPMYYDDISSRVIYLKSFSKILLPGLRIAAVVLPKILTNVFKEYKKWADLSTSVLSQGALEIYIKSGMFKAHVKKIRKTYSERMNLVKKELAQANMPYLKCHVPDTGFFACIELIENVNVSNIIKELRYSSNIYLEDVEKNYLKDYFNDNILKISIARANSENIKSGIPIILDKISKIKEEKSFYNDVFNI